MLKKCLCALLTISIQLSRINSQITMSSGENSCSTGKENAIPVKVLAFDFDKTCTTKAVLDIYKSREDYQIDKEYKANTLDKEWKKLENFYGTLMQKILIPLKEEKAMPTRFDEDGLRRFLKEVQVADTRAVDEVIQSNVLKGITPAGLKHFADKVELMPDLLKVLDSLKIFHLPLHVISLNFSKKLIENVLSRGGSLPLDVHANELEFESGVCTGNMDKKIVSAFDKEVILDKIVQNAQKRCGVTIYIGDSYTDLLALLKADIGLIIGNSKSILKVCNDFGVRVTPLCEQSFFRKSYTNGRFSGKESATDLHPVLFSVASWEEIKDFIFNFKKPGK